MNIVLFIGVTRSPFGRQSSVICRHGGGTDCPRLSSEQLACKYVEGRGNRGSAVGLSERRTKGLGTPKRTGVSHQRLQNMEAVGRGGRSGRQRGQDVPGGKQAT